MPPDAAGTDGGTGRCAKITLCIHTTRHSVKGVSKNQVGFHLVGQMHMCTHYWTEIGLSLDK